MWPSSVLPTILTVRVSVYTTLLGVSLFWKVKCCANSFRWVLTLNYILRPGGNPAAVSPSSSQAERTHTLCVFTGRFNGVEMAATSGMLASAAVTSDGKGLQAVGVDEPSFFTRLADPAVKTCRSAASWGREGSVALRFCPPQFFCTCRLTGFTKTPWLTHNTNIVALLGRKTLALGIWISIM